MSEDNGKKPNFYLQFKIKDKWGNYLAFGGQLRVNGGRRHSPDFIPKVIHRNVDLSVEEEELRADCLRANVAKLELDEVKRAGIDFQLSCLRLGGPIALPPWLGHRGCVGKHKARG